MKKRWLTMAAVCLCLLCAACGQKEAVSASASDSTSVAEVTQTPAPTPDTTTLEGRLRVGMTEEPENLDLTLTLGLNQEDGNLIRSATLQRRATGDNVAWAISLPDSQVWFSRDTAYVTGSYGSYQGSISLEDFQAAVPSLPQLLYDLPDWTAEEAESGYTVAFSGEDTGLWQYFLPMISRMVPALAQPECTALSLSGTAELTETGAVTAMRVKLTLDLDGQTVELLAELSSQPTEALPELPDTEFLELSDPILPGLVVTAYEIAAADATQSYQNLIHLTVTEDDTERLYKQQDVISSSQGQSGLSCAWDTTYGLDEEVLRTVEDRYAQGVGSLTEGEDVTYYSYDDDSMWADISGFITAYESALNTATAITQSESDGYTAITLTLDEDAFAAPILSGFLQQLTELDLEDAEVVANGTLTLWVTESGTLHGQALLLEGTLTPADGEPVSLTLNDWGLVNS